MISRTPSRECCQDLLDAALTDSNDPSILIRPSRAGHLSASTLHPAVVPAACAGRSHERAREHPAAQEGLELRLDVARQ
jgi:hypothetical protein